MCKVRCVVAYVESTYTARLTLCDLAQIDISDRTILEINNIYEKFERRYLYKNKLDSSGSVCCCCTAEAEFDN